MDDAVLTAETKLVLAYFERIMTSHVACSELTAQP
jgi:hypothetical protein